MREEFIENFASAQEINMLNIKQVGELKSTH